MMGESRHPATLSCGRTCSRDTATFVSNENIFIVNPRKERGFEAWFSRLKFIFDLESCVCQCYKFHKFSEYAEL